MTQHQIDSDPANAGERPLALRAERTDGRLQIFRPGMDLPLLIQHAGPDWRPYIHPILAPDGVGALTEDGAGMHHPWQHGLFIGLNDVNGVGFWTEEAGVDGTFHPQPLAQPKLDGQSVQWLVGSEWRSPGGIPLVEETQAWRFHDQGAEFVLDLDWTLRGLVDLVFGQYAYGGLYLRSSYRPNTGARVLNSEGQVNLDVDGQRARWAAVELPIVGRETCQETVCSIAILDHPTNPEHPVPWRTDRHVGLAPSRCIAGAWTLARGESTRSRYRLLIRCGPADRSRIDAAWGIFAGE
ncbi:MAG: PmoA family protein [Caldilineaceae bacterium]|nr:PmoA family protein [Caldilineaceae bacterium]MBP9075204.1 PmoA family protein [Caldilineaceae bacterium]